MLDLPLWRFVAFVNTWAAQNCAEGKEAMLEAELQRQIEWKWIRGQSSETFIGSANPARWQSNTPGESLLSRHRQTKAGGQ